MNEQYLIFIFHNQTLESNLDASVYIAADGNSLPNQV